MSQTRKKRIDSLKCPACGEKTLKKIVYGMPGDDFDFKNNFVGGVFQVPKTWGARTANGLGFAANFMASRF